MDLGLIYDIRCKVICCLVRYVTIIIMAIYQHLIIEAWQPRGPCPPRDETKYAGYPGLRVNRLNVWNSMVGMGETSEIFNPIHPWTKNTRHTMCHHDVGLC